MHGREGGCGPRPGSPGSPAARPLSSHGLGPSCPFPQPSTSLPCPSGLASWKKQPPFSRLEHWNVQQGGPGHSPEAESLLPVSLSSSGDLIGERSARLAVARGGFQTEDRTGETRGQKGHDRRKRNPIGNSEHSWKRRLESPCSEEANECSTWGILILRAGPWASPAQKGFPGKRRQ